MSTVLEGLPSEKTGRRKAEWLELPIFIHGMSPDKDPGTGEPQYGQLLGRVREALQRYPGKKLSDEKIFVTCHDHVCAAIYGRLKELVILRITRRANRLKYVDDFDERCDAFEERVAPLPADVAIEFRGVQFLDQFT